MSSPEPPAERLEPREKVKRVPDDARRLPDEGRPGPGHLRRQGEEPPQPGRALLHARPPPRTAAPATWSSVIADVDFLAGRQRGRRPADGGPAGQGHPAAASTSTSRTTRSFPYLQIRIARGLPARRVHPQAAGARASSSTARSPAPRACGGRSRCCSGSSSSAPARSTSSDDDPRWRWFRPCLLHSIHQCTAPCNFRVDREDVPQADPPAAPGPRRQEGRLLERDGGGDAGGEQGAAVREGGPAPRRDRAPCRTSSLRGDVDKDAQPEVFHDRPAEGPDRAAEGPRAGRRRRGPSRASTSPTSAASETVGSLVTFIDGLPFKPGYRRYKIKSVEGVDDFASIREVVARRFRRPASERGRASSRTSC